MVEEGADSKVRKFVIWKVLEVLSWADWQGAEVGDVSVLVGKEERSSRSTMEVGEERRRLYMVWIIRV